MTDYEVAEYMVSSLDGTRHAALLARPGSGVVFNGQQSRWIPEPGQGAHKIDFDDIYRATFLARDELLATANKYRKKLRQPTLTLDTTHNWFEVQDSVLAACTGLEELAEEDKDMSGSLGRLKRAFRGLCRNAGVGQTAATVIPNDSFGFTSVLCGSLKVVFTGLRATGLYRQEVYRTLEGLPTQLKDLATNVNLYEHDEQVHVHAAALYVASFRLLNHILLWFLKNTWATGVKLLLDPLGFTDKLRDYQAELKMASQTFGAHLTTLSRTTELETMQLQYMTAFAQTKIHNQLEALVKFKDDFEESQAKIEERERRARVEVLENLHPLLNNIMTALQQRAITDGASSSSNSVPEINIDKLLTDFLYEPELVVNDCASLVKKFEGKGSRVKYDINRISAYNSHPRLRAWLTYDEQSLILLNGRAEPRADSEVSLFAAKMVERLLAHYQAQIQKEQQESIMIPLVFFCGQHRDWKRDSNGNPEELAMSLLLQLVDRGRHYLDPTILQDFYQRTTGGNIESICSTFDRFVCSLGRRVILVVVVDGIRYFAQPTEQANNMKEVVSRMLQTYRNDPAATLKILFTSPTRSDFLEEFFHEDELLEMPRDVPEAGMESIQRMRV